MSTLICLYCQENFNNNSHCPLKLECEHTFCKSCVDELMFFLRICPLDKKKVNYRNSHPNTKVLIDLQNSCNTHFRLIVGYCKAHLCILCEDCLIYHSNCTIVKGDIRELDSNLIKEYKTSNSKALDLKKQTQKFFEFDTINILNTFTKNLIKARDCFMKLKEFKSNKTQNLRYLKRYSQLLESFSIAPYKNIKEQILNLFILDSHSQSLLDLGKLGDTDKLLKDMMERFLQMDKEVIEEADVLVNYLQCQYTYFIKTVKNNSPSKYTTYMANLWQVGIDAFPFNIIGLGNPIDPDGYLLLHNLELHMNDQLIWSIKDLIIRKKNSRLCFFLIIPFMIVIMRGNKVFFQIELEGTPSYLFHITKQDDCVRVTDVDNIEYSGNFPVLYLGYTDQINKLSELNIIK